MVKVERRKKAVKPVYPFQNIEEEAKFWDRHSAVEEIREGTPVGFHRSHKSRSLTIRFAAEDLERIRAEANQRGIGPTTLARMWLLERLRQGKNT